MPAAPPPAPRSVPARSMKSTRRGSRRDVSQGVPSHSRVVGLDQPVDQLLDHGPVAQAALPGGRDAVDAPVGAGQPAGDGGRGVRVVAVAHGRGDDSAGSRQPPRRHPRPTRSCPRRGLCPARPVQASKASSARTAAAGEGASCEPGSPRSASTARRSRRASARTARRSASPASSRRTMSDVERAGDLGLGAAVRDPRGPRGQRHELLRRRRRERRAAGPGCA